MIVIVGQARVTTGNTDGNIINPVASIAGNGAQNGIMCISFADGQTKYSNTTILENFAESKFVFLEHTFTNFPFAQPRDFIDAYSVCGYNNLFDGSHTTGKSGYLAASAVDPTSENRLHAYRWVRGKFAALGIASAIVLQYLEKHNGVRAEALEQLFRGGARNAVDGKPAFLKPGKFHLNRQYVKMPVPPGNPTIEVLGETMRQEHGIRPKFFDVTYDIVVFDPNPCGKDFVIECKDVPDVANKCVVFQIGGEVKDLLTAYIMTLQALGAVMVIMNTPYVSNQGDIYIPVFRMSDAFFTKNKDALKTSKVTLRLM